MPWYLPDKYHDNLKNRVREYVKTRRDKFLLPTFWEWRVLEVFCDEIDRLQIVADKNEADAGRIKNHWDAFGSQAERFYEVVQSVVRDEYRIVEHMKVFTTQDDANDSIVWIAPSKSLRGVEPKSMTIHPITWEWINDNNILLFETEAIAKAYIRRELREAAVEARKNAAALTQREQELKRKLKEYE